jgi:hypothetical protein
MCRNSPAPSDEVESDSMVRMIDMSSISGISSQDLTFSESDRCPASRDLTNHTEVLDGVNEYLGRSVE